MSPACRDLLVVSAIETAAQAARFRVPLRRLRRPRSNRRSAFQQMLSTSKLSAVVLQLLMDATASEIGRTVHSPRAGRSMTDIRCQALGLASSSLTILGFGR